MASSPHPVLELDGDGRLLFANEAARYVADAFDRTDARDALQAELRFIVRDCLRGGAPVSGLRASIDGRDVVWTFVPMPSCGVVHAYPVDVSRQREIEARASASESLLTLGRLSAATARSVGKEVRTIARALEALPGSPARDRAAAAAARAKSVVRRLSAMARRQSGRPRLMSPREIIEDVEALLQPLVPAPIALRVQGVLPGRVWAEPGALQKALIDLALDACEAMPRGGRLAIGVSAAGHGGQGAPRHIGLIPGPHAVFTVLDVPAPGESAPRGRARADWSSLRETLRAWKGDLWIHRAPGGGLRREVHLPMWGGSASRPRRAAGTRQTTVLLIGPNAAARAGAASVLRAGGFRVLQCVDQAGGEQRVARARGRVALVIADLRFCRAPGDLAARMAALQPGIKTLFSPACTYAGTTCLARLDRTVRAVLAAPNGGVAPSRIVPSKEAN
ncbi:MAG TPA: hypothetical protein VJV23_02875 [Candidatus Polarisedimenticolia bacterium]|nr:hypothetical protein [Candidatus Polarisedimenticolia bacterium]